MEIHHRVIHSKTRARTISLMIPIWIIITHTGSGRASAQSLIAITGSLWDTENGEDKFDEINLVKPGFNSG